MTPAFRDGSFGQRLTVMGDTAEAKFEEWAEKVGLGYVRFGLDRPKIAVPKLPARLRYTPDYLMTANFVEVMGFGREQKLRLKMDKYGAMRWWNDLWPVKLYCWDSHKERECIVTIKELEAVIGAEGGCEFGRFREGKPFFQINGQMLFDLSDPAAEPVSA